MLEIVGSFLFKKKEVLLSSAMLSFKTFILGDAGVLVCPCVLELGSVMVTEVVPASSSAWLFTQDLLNLLSLLFKVSEVPLEFVEAGFGPWTMTVPLW